ncbi:MAG: hypothetical protein FJ386_05165 [Verrucomicrobia bacterium]|nr:hypothetical protein [Verrucomicrobiota bacterium]
MQSTGDSFRVAQSGAVFVRLQSRRATAELRALAPDLFRLRLTRGRDFAARPSMAIEKVSWPSPATRLIARGHVVELRTFTGSVRFDTSTARWALRDARGRLALDAVESRFARDHPRVALALRDAESIHGLGAMTGPLDRRGLVREFWNIDVLGHASCLHPGLRSTYVSIPFAITLRGGSAAGIFWDNAARQVWDMGHATAGRWSLRAEEGEVDLYLFAGPRVPDILERYTELTGRTPLPPHWALGYHQCRFGYTSRDEVESMARGLRRRRFPCSALWLDIDHMDGHRVFTFGKSFPRPREMLAKLRRAGFRVVAITNPGVKNDRRFAVLRRGRALAAFVKVAGGKRDFIGKVWPGRCRFPDFMSPRARAWWAREQARFMRLGLAGIWCDMNEPALFDTAGKTLPPDAVHRPAPQETMRHTSAHNLYGLAMAAAAREGARRVNPRERPFVLTRAGYAGIQRHAAVWTGDNSSTWEHLAASVPALLNLGLSGVAFCGADVGGFLDSPTPELFARWMQLGALTPFFRNHSNKDSRPQEPWEFGPEVERISRNAIRLRMKLLPYLAQCFAEASARGWPVMRPLLFHFQDDPIAAACNDQFLVGADLLVAPVLAPGIMARSVYLPRGRWRDAWTGRVLRGGRHVPAQAPLDRIPLFVRASAGKSVAIGKLRG